MRELLLATNNPGKLKELQELLSDLDITILTPAMLGIADFDVEETGKTFEENAELKARAFAEKTGKLTLADDSGLEVAALDGFPGVRSKRFLEGTDHDRNQKILRLLEGVENRSARFVAIFCLYDPKQEIKEIFIGEANGDIALAEKGLHGFGYDPLFILKGYTQTLGELGTEVKNRLSHRARAAEKVKEYFRSKKAEEKSA